MPPATKHRHTQSAGRQGAWSSPTLSALRRSRLVTDFKRTEFVLPETTGPRHTASFGRTVHGQQHHSPRQKGVVQVWTLPWQGVVPVVLEHPQQGHHHLHTLCHLKTVQCQRQGVQAVLGPVKTSWRSQGLILHHLLLHHRRHHLLRQSLRIHRHNAHQEARKCRA